MKALCRFSAQTLLPSLALFCLLSLPVTAAVIEYKQPDIVFPILQNNVKNWSPTQFDILCGGVGGPINPDLKDTSCMDLGDELNFEAHLHWAAEELRDLQFHNPDGFGPVISDNVTGEKKSSDLYG